MYDLDTSVQWRAFLVRKSRKWPGLRDPRHQLEMVEFLPGIHYGHFYAQVTNARSRGMMSKRQKLRDSLRGLFRTDRHTEV